MSACVKAAPAISLTSTGTAEVRGTSSPYQSLSVHSGFSYTSVWRQSHVLKDAPKCQRCPFFFIMPYLFHEREGERERERGGWVQEHMNTVVPPFYNPLFDFIPKGNFLSVLTNLYFKTTCNIRPLFLVAWVVLKYRDHCIHFGHIGMYVIVRLCAVPTKLNRCDIICITLQESFW